MPYKMSALLSMALMCMAAAVQTEEVARNPEVCQIGDGGACEDSVELLDNSNDALSLIQMKTSEMSATVHSHSSSSRSKEIASLLETAMSMYKEQGEVTPAVQKFLKSVLVSLDELLPVINNEHTIDSKHLESRYGSLKDLKADLEKRTKWIKTYNSFTVTPARAALAKCRKEESVIWKNLETCKEEQAALLAIKKGKEDALIATSNKLKAVLVGKGSLLDPKLRSAAAALVDTYADEHLALNVAIKNLNEKIAECKGLAKDLKWKSELSPKSCKALQYAFEATVCNSARATVLLFGSIQGKLKDESAAFDAAKASVKIRTSDRKAEYTGIMSAKCILKAVFGDPTHDKIEKCKSVVYDDTHLDIKLEATPASPPYVPLPPFPCEAKFLKNEYSNMPEGTKASKCTKCWDTVPKLPPRE